MTAQSDELRLADGSVVRRAQTLRSLPGKRDVFAGERGGEPVVVKVYLDQRRAEVHARREVDGLSAFHAASVLAPALLFDGVDVTGRPVVVVRRIAEAVDLAARWRVADRDDKRGLIRQMMSVLAGHHAAGIEQTDPHPGNFLVAADQIYSLDGAGVNVRSGELNEQTSLDNLALFLAQFPPDDDALGIEAAARYFEIRGWSGDAGEYGLPRLVDVARMSRWRHLRPKLYRDCSAVLHAVVNAHEIFARRAMGEPLLELCADLDASLPADPAAWLKNGNSATVWRAPLGDDHVVVKRYNTKSFVHGVRQGLKESRASVSWRYAHMLQLFGIATPEPLALVYGPRRGVRRPAYFITRALSGASLADWIQHHRDDPAAVESVVRHVARVFAKLRELRISHGDMKASNFLLEGAELNLIDLDAMRWHRASSSFARAWGRDVSRFLANWDSDPELRAQMVEAIAPERR